MFRKAQMATKPPRRVPQEAAATPKEIAAAIEALTLGDWARLKRYADNRIWSLGPKADGRTGDDLMQTAMLALLADTRRWNKDKVGFLTLLKGAIRSISSNWAKSFKVEETAVLEADLRRENEEGDTYGPLDNVEEQRPNAEQHLHHEQTIDQIEAIFREDEQAQMVLMAWQERYDAPGVRELWKLSQREYDTIVRKIRRRIDAAGLTPDFGRGKSNV